MNSHYRWVIVAAGAFMGCVAIGSIFSLPVFLQPMSVATGWSRTAISLAMTLDFVTMGIASFGWGMLMDRFGPRIVLLSGRFHSGPRPGAGEPGVHRRGVSVALRRSGRGRRRRHFRAADGDRHRVVRPPSQPGGLAGLRRHGSGAHDRGSHRGGSRFDVRLAVLSTDRRPQLSGCCCCRRRSWCAARLALRAATRRGARPSLG